jgi:hypothetical protein
MNELDEATFQAIYGRWAPLAPAEMATLLDRSQVRWWVVGGRAARFGASARGHSDIDIALSRSDLPRLRDSGGG